ncbi:MAG: AMP-binding protein, partial [Pseudomonadota bacterium]
TRTVIEAGAVLPPQLKDLVTCIDPISEGASELVIDSGPPRREAYHLFTSGTTGRPKLTSHPDKTVQRFIHWLQQNFTELDTPATIMMAGLAHDPMLRDVFWPLSSGGYIAIPTPCEMTRPAELRNLIKQARCNCVRFSASTAQLLTTAMPDTEQFSDVQAILWGGERLPIDVARKWQDLAPGARQFNVYGTTETPQAVMIHEISKEQSWGRDVALGRPLPWSGIRLLDTDGRPVSRGELGEIVVNLPDPVAGSFRRFATDPAPEHRVHYTGDLGYQAPDGNIYFAGRSDDQVKINGYRIELREVETAAERVPGIERASVVIVDDRLSLFAQTSISDVTIRSLRAALTQNLPDYMVPANIYIVPDLPCTANGKIDRAALSIKAQNPAVPSADAADLTPPRTPLEHSIAQVFAHQARQARIGREHSLSDLGADSLAAIETRLKLEKLGLILSDAWQWASVAELAAQNAAQPEPRTQTANASTLQRTEMFILLRCIAILAIVAFHTGFRVTGGASIVLFVLAGYSFVQLQLPAILNDGHPRRVWALMTRLLIPLVPMSLIYLGYDIYRDVATDPSSMLFYRNLTEVINAVFAPGTDPVEGLAWLWFLHAYLQIFLIFGLLLSSSWIRTALAQDLWRRLLMFFIIAEGISILSLLGMAQLVDQSADVGNILHRNPIALIPFLIVGGLVAAARTTSRQVISFAVVALHSAVVAQFYADHNELWWVLALVLCALCPFVSLPKSMSKLVIAIASYSLMIYLTHHAVFIVMHKLIGGSDLARVASVFAQISFGVVFGYLMRPVIARFSAPRQTDAVAQST